MSTYKNKLIERIEDLEEENKKLKDTIRFYNDFLVFINTEAKAILEIRSKQLKENDHENSINKTT